ncbi:ABC transporter inner membrane subunit [Salipiger profundus]|jgi:phospholipid/cholesterol/gamma-HCH transport system permease protein|nr:ABC transporter inner membrane subunit [Salipiger profundus]
MPHPQEDFGTVPATLWRARPDRVRMGGSGQDQTETTPMSEEGFTSDFSGDGAAGVLTLGGALTVHTVTALRDSLAPARGAGDLVVDMAGVDRMDTAGAWALAELEAQIAQRGGTTRLRHAGDEALLLLDTVRAALPAPETPAERDRGLIALLEATGRRVATGAAFLRDLLAYLGLFLVALWRVVTHPREFRFTALVAHADDVGLRAVPIVGLMAFLIGVVLAFQGSAQLRQFGAEVFVVDLIAISILRELGILLTAIIVAGRTASAFTAAIGSMKMREEIDAMRTLGLDPATVLFVPRILALLLMLPILGLVANVMGLIGGALMSWIDLGISPSMFRARLIADTDVSHVFVGLVKAPVFALIIGVVGCHAGMQVQGNAESLGRMTSNAVVTAIFAVIVADALFSIFFAQVGL